MDNNTSKDTKRFWVIALTCGLAFYVLGPVGLACVALWYLLS